MKHSISYGAWGLLSVTTDLKLVGCVIDNFLRILGIIFTIKFYDVKSAVLSPKQKIMKKVLIGICHICLRKEELIYGTMIE